MKNFIVLSVFIVQILCISNALNSDTNEKNVKVSVPSVPGFKTTVTQSGLDYLQQIGVQVLESSISSLTIPDISGEIGSFIGDIDYWLTGITLDTLQLPTSSIEIQPGAGLQLSITGATCEIHLSWQYRKKSWPHVSDHGTCDIDASSTNIVVALAVTTSNGLPYLTVSGTSVDIGNLDIHLHGGASWLYQLFVDAFSGNIKDSANKALEDAISTNVAAGLNKALSTLPIMQPINKEVEINYELLGNPLFTADYMNFPQAGEFFSIANPQECPASVCPSPAIPDWESTTDMVQMVVSDYVANSAGFVFFGIGKLEMHITADQIPSWSPIKLNTTSWKYLVPGLYQMYPNNAMEVHVYSTQPPQITFTPTGAVVKGIGNLEMMVIVPNGTLVSAFTLNGWLATNGEVTINGQALYGNLTYAQGNFTLAETNVGDFSVQILYELLNMLFSRGVIPEVNTYLATGFPLPTVQGVSFQDSTLSFGDRYIVVSTNIQYTPPTMRPEISHPLKPITIN